MNPLVAEAGQAEVKWAERSEWGCKWQEDGWKGRFPWANQNKSEYPSSFYLLAFCNPSEHEAAVFMGLV